MSAQNFSIKDRLIRIKLSITIMIAMTSFQSRFDEKNVIKVCSKFFN